MRVVRELTHPDCKITIFSWNNRYLIKLEQGLLEQTFKISEFDVSGEQDISELLDAEFVHQAVTRFVDMGHSLHAARTRHGV